MTTTQTETWAIDRADFWDDETDGRFFNLTAGLFSPRFTEGATALLQSYDVV